MSAHRPFVQFMDLGLIDYKKAWDYQTLIHNKIKEHKKNLPNTTTSQNSLIFCEHPPVYTLGKSGHINNLQYSTQELDEAGISFYKINRGGDITYHGPGQLVVYPIFDLELFRRDVHWYVRQLEEVIIRVLQSYDIQAERIPEYTGVWVRGNPDRKICAIGVHISRWVTLHGLAFNVSPNLKHFQGIIPCGISDASKTVTSIDKELKQSINMTVLKNKLKAVFREVFQFEYKIEQ